MMRHSYILPILCSTSIILSSCEAPGPGSSGESKVEPGFQAGVTDSFTSGGGTVGFLARWSAGTSLDKSVVFEAPVGTTGRGNLGINTNGPQAALDVVGLTDFSAILIPRDTQANRPSVPVNGMIRYNSTTNVVEGFINGLWQAFANLTTNQAFLADVSVAGNFSVTGTSAHTGAATFASTVGITGATTLGSTLSVAGASTLTGATSVGSTLGVTGATTLNSTLAVTGASTLTGATSVGSTLGVTGATTLNSTLAVTGASTLTGATSVGSTLGVTGATTLNSTLAVTGASTLTGATSVGSTLGVTGATTLNSTLGVTGATNLGSTLGVTGNSTFTGTSTMNGAASMTAGANVANGLTVTGGATVTGASTFNSATSFGAGTTISAGGTTVTGASTFNSATSFNAGAAISGAALTMGTQSITGVGGNITGSGALTVAAGGAANNLVLSSATTGAVNITSGNGTSLSVLDGGAGTVNFVSVTGAATTFSPVIGTAGADTNISLTLVPKGSGNVLVNSGNVGLGASASVPDTNLDLAGTGATLNGLTSVTMQVRDTNASAADVGGKIAFSGQDGTGNARFAAIAGRKENGTNANNAGYLGFFTRANGGNLTERMRVDSAGNVGIGTSGGGFLLDVNGTFRAFGMTDSSDLRLKREVQPLGLEPELAKVLQLQGVSYYWRDPAHGTRKQIGFIAQEVEKIYPELVETDKKGFKSLAYAHLVAPLVNSVRALFSRIEALASWQKRAAGEIQVLRMRIFQAEQRALNAEAEASAVKAWICAKDSSAAFCAGR